MPYSERVLLLVAPRLRVNGHELLRCHSARMCLMSPRTPAFDHFEGVGVERAVVPLVADRPAAGPCPWRA